MVPGGLEVVVVTLLAVAAGVVELPAGKGAEVTVVEGVVTGTTGVVEVEVVEVVGGVTGVEEVDEVDEVEELELELVVDEATGELEMPLEPEQGKVTM